MSRHTCINCNKKREEKYMVNIQLENLTEKNNCGWLCYFHTTRFDPFTPNCRTIYLRKIRRKTEKILLELNSLLE